MLPTLTGGAPLVSRTLRIARGEGDLAGPLSDFADSHPDLSVGSYPFMKDGVHGSNIVVRGSDVARLDQAMKTLEALFAA